MIKYELGAKSIKLLKLSLETNKYIYGTFHVFAQKKKNIRLKLDIFNVKKELYQSLRSLVFVEDSNVLSRNILKLFPNIELIELDTYIGHEFCLLQLLNQICDFPLLFDQNKLKIFIRGYHLW